MTVFYQCNIQFKRFNNITLKIIDEQKVNEKPLLKLIKLNLLGKRLR